MPRQPKGHSKTYYSKYDKLWHTWVHVGTKPNGKPDRKNVRGKTATESADLAGELRERIKRGSAVPTKIDTVGEWLTYWVHDLVKDDLEYKSWRHYEVMVRLHLNPNIGSWKLDGLGKRLEPEHLIACYATLSKKLARSYVRQNHNMIKQAIDAAMAHGRASRNPARMIKGPKKVRKRKVKAHSLDEIQAIVQTAMDDPLAERWLIGMLLGPRQGEALAIRWNKVGLDAQSPMLTIDEQVQRRSWEHGCDDPVACVQLRDVLPCRTLQCPPKYQHGCRDVTSCKKLAHFCPLRKVDKGKCARHKSAGKDGKRCPPLCPSNCAGHASTCPQRINGGMVAKDVKSESGEREIPLFKVIVDLLRARREDQIRRSVFAEDGLVFRGPTGLPIDSRRDHEAWEQLLKRAGVADSRLHAARHTAGTLLASKADIAVVQEILGHADIRQTRQYVDIAKELKRNAVDAIAAAVLDGNLAALLQPRSATNSITARP